MHHIDPAFMAPLPPSIYGDIGMHIGRNFALSAIVLLSLEWSWRLCWALYERPHPRQHPLTLFRVVVLLLLASGLMRIAPDLWLYGNWAYSTPIERSNTAWMSGHLKTLSLLPFGSAWYAGVYGASVWDHMLVRKPIPVDLYPTREKLRRPLWIVLGALATALVTALLPFYLGR